MKAAKETVGARQDAARSALDLLEKRMDGWIKSQLQP